MQKHYGNSSLLADHSHILRKTWQSES